MSRDPRREPKPYSENEPYTDETVPLQRPPQQPPRERAAPSQPPQPSAQPPRAPLPDGTIRPIQQPRRTPPPPAASEQASRRPPQAQGAPAQSSRRPPSSAARPPLAPAQPGRKAAQPRVKPPLVRPKPRRTLGSWVRTILTILLAVTAVAIVGLILYQQQIAGKVRLADVRQSRPPATLLTSPLNILLLGVDLREGFPEEGVRSDSLILLHLDPGGGWGSLLSIPRDTLADVPGYGTAKINAAFGQGYALADTLYGDGTDPTAGGAALAADTVEQFLDLPSQGQRINYVATINFNGFAKLIDAVGGIDVDVPYAIYDPEYPTPDFGTTVLEIPAGPQHMNGDLALKYVRTRHSDSDFGRAQRQQQVIAALVTALREQPAVLRPFAAMRLVNAASDATRTTMPIGRPDALLMAAMLTRVDPGRIGQYRLDPEKVGLTESGSDLIWNAADVQALVREMLSPPGEAQEQATVQVQNGVGVAGVAGQLSGALDAASFTMAAATDAEPAERSQIIDYGDHPATRTRLSQQLGNMPVVEGSSQDAPAGVDIVVRLGADYEQYWSGQ